MEKEALLKKNLSRTDDEFHRAHALTLLFIVFFVFSSCGLQASLKDTSSTASTANSGLSFVTGGNSFGGDSSVGNLDSFKLDFLTAGLPRITITSAGQVGIGTSTPVVALDVNGALRPGSSTTVVSCGVGSANGEGSLRYNYTNHAMEYCNGTSWLPLIATAGSGTPSTPPASAGYLVITSGTWNGNLGGQRQMSFRFDCERLERKS
jgi:hypothetical protein